MYQSQHNRYPETLISWFHDHFDSLNPWSLLIPWPHEPFDPLNSWLMLDLVIPLNPWAAPSKSVTEISDWLKKKMIKKNGAFYASWCKCKNGVEIWDYYQIFIEIILHDSFNYFRLIDCNIGYLNLFLLIFILKNRNFLILEYLTSLDNLFVFIFENLFLYESLFIILISTYYLYY